MIAGAEPTPLEHASDAVQVATVGPVVVAGLVVYWAASWAAAFWAWVEEWMEEMRCEH